MKEINSASELEQLKKGGKPVLIDFYADWCGPCQTMLPIVDELANKYNGDIEVVKVNIDNHREIAREFGVRNIPSLFFIENGEIKEHLVGLQPKAVLDLKLQSYAA
ncbi:MAG: thioredoxin [Fluviicola sp.]